MEENRRGGPTPGTAPRASGAGYQSGSEEPPVSAETPESGSSPGDANDDGYEPVDPYKAHAEVAANERERKKREREPAIWIPEPDDLDRDGPEEDAETRFSRDAYGGRGNPQVSVRLRPRDFERLCQAADLYGVPRTTFARMMVIRGVGAVLDAELRRKAEYLDT